MEDAAAVRITLPLADTVAPLLMVRLLPASSVMLPPWALIDAATVRLLVAWRWMLPPVSAFTAAAVTTSFGAAVPLVPAARFGSPLPRATVLVPVATIVRL